MTTGHRNITLGPGEGKVVSAFGFDITIKARSEDTNPSFGLLELKAPPGLESPPPHVHNGFEESLYVLDGEVTLTVGDQTVKGTKGSFVKVARGVAHSVDITSAGTATLLILCTPGGFEKFFEEMPELVAKHGDPVPTEIMMELPGKYDMHVVEPPPSH